MSQPQTDAQRDDLATIYSRVINVVGHELRTPVALVHGLAEQLLTAQDLDVVSSQIGPALLRNTARLTRLLDDLLIASGISTAIPVEAAVSTNLAEVIAQLWAALSESPMALAGDLRAVALKPRSTVMVLQAVLANASQYGSGTGVELRPREDGATVTVTSGGGSISDDEIRLATQPFFRGEAAVTARPGLGLGLAVASQVLLEIGGAISLSRGPDGEVITTIDLIEVDV